MKKLIFLALLFLPLSALAEKPVAYFFTRPGCGACARLKKEFLPEVKKKYGKQIEIMELDVANAKNSIFFNEVAELYGQERLLPALAVGDSFFIGYPRDVGYNAGPAIEKALRNNEATRVPQEERTAEEVFSGITLGAIILNGLVDGINPCAFAVIVFFISFLAAYGYKKKEVVYIGVTYCLAVFSTYLLLGFGIFKFLYALESFQIIKTIIFWVTIILCTGLLIFCIYDLVVYLKTKRSDGLILQLPKSFKLMANRITGRFLRGKEGSGVFVLVLSTFAVGVLVSLVEALCTGQVYIPTIVLIMKEPHFRIRALSYLLVYNFMFIIPLIVVFALTLMGYTSERFNKFLKENLALTKLLMALVFLGLIVLLLINY